MKKISLPTSQDIASELSNIASTQKKQELLSSLHGCFHLAEQALSQGKLDLSLNYLDKGLELDGSNRELIIAKIKVYFELKDWQEIRELIDYLIYLDPNDKDSIEGKKLIEARIDYYKKVKAFPLYS